MFSLRGPLCAGEAFSGSLRSRGGVVSRGETWGPGSASSQAPRLHPTYLHCVGCAKKGGPLSCDLRHAIHKCGALMTDVTLSHVLVERCMINGGEDGWR